MTVAQLTDYFFEAIDPYSPDRQGADTGEKYRTGAYSENLSRLREAAAYIRARPDRGRICVEATSFSRYVPSAEEHEDHPAKRPDDYCHVPEES